MTESWGWAAGADVLRDDSTRLLKYQGVELQQICRPEWEIEEVPFNDREDQAVIAEAADPEPDLRLLPPPAPAAPDTRLALSSMPEPARTR